MCQNFQKWVNFFAQMLAQFDSIFEQDEIVTLAKDKPSTKTQLLATERKGNHEATSLQIDLLQLLEHFSSSFSRFLIVFAYYFS